MADTLGGRFSRSSRTTPSTFPIVDPVAIDQLLIQDFLAELHFSLPSVEEG
jgi:hypothetical protein